MRLLMLNYEYPPLGGGGSNACKYLLKKLLIVQALSNNPRNFLNGAGVATPDPGEAPPMAEFTMI